MSSHDYPDAPGFRPGAPETSREAAESIADEAKTIELRLLAIVRAAGVHGVTADEAAAIARLPNAYASRPRLSTLRARGKIADSGARRKNASGRRAAVWTLPEYAPEPPPPASLTEARHD